MLRITDLFVQFLPLLGCGHFDDGLVFCWIVARVVRLSFRFQRRSLLLLPTRWVFNLSLEVHPGSPPTQFLEATRFLKGRSFPGIPLDHVGHKRDRRRRIISVHVGGVQNVTLLQFKIIVTIQIDLLAPVLDIGRETLVVGMGRLNNEINVSFGVGRVPL